MKLSEVLGMEVVTAAGAHRGHVLDLRSSGEADRGQATTARVITEIVIGRVTWLERMGLRSVHEEIIPWAEVATVGTRRVTLKNG